MARRVVALICALMVFVGVLRFMPRQQLGRAAADSGDAELYSVVVARVHNGEPYYDALGSELRRRDYPAASIFNWRAPLLYSALAVSVAGSQLVLVALSGLLVFLTTRAPYPGLTPVLVANSLVLVFTRAVYFTDTWAGVCIGLSVVALTSKRQIAGVAWAILALAIRELAAPYCVAMTLYAAWRRDWRELKLWALGAGLYGCYYGWHVWHATQHIVATDLSHPHSWLDGGGLGFMLRAFQWTGVWVLAPEPLFACVIVLAVAAWWGPMPARVRIAVLVYAAFFTAAGQSFDVYWGWVIGPVFAISMAYAPAGISRIWSTGLVGWEVPRRRSDRPQAIEQPSTSGR